MQKQQKTNKYLQAILKTTPKTIKVQNAINTGDELQDRNNNAVFVEFGDLVVQS